MPTPVGPAPRDPDDPDSWDWSDDVWAPSDGHEPALAARLARRRQLWRLVTILGLALLLVYILATIL